VTTAQGKFNVFKGWKIVECDELHFSHILDKIARFQAADPYFIDHCPLLDFLFHPTKIRPAG
jgi:hypothetical protein